MDDLFDVAVLGTTATAAAFAAAAARAGKRVVHLDAHDFYGGADASLPLPQFLRLLGEVSSGGVGGGGGAVAAAAPAAVLPPGLSVSLELPAQLSGDALRASLLSVHRAGAPSPPSPSPTPIPSSLPADVDRVARKVIVDLRPRFTLARGPLTDLLVRSGVANYVEYKPLDGAFVVAAAAGGARGSSPWRLRRVPASKADIFGDADLSLLEKRRLMKFLLFAHDAHVAAEQAAEEARQAEEEKEAAAQAEREAEARRREATGSASSSSSASAPTSSSASALPASSSSSSSSSAAAAAAVGGLNERTLGAGRSLLRPQNKATPAFDVAAFAAQPLGVFLRHASVTGPLHRMLAHAVALQEEAGSDGGDALPSPPSSLPNAPPSFNDRALNAADGMARIQRYLGALGRFGSTAFLANLYGSGEVPQAFSRLCAVNGGIYMLRTAPTAWLLGTHEEGGDAKGVEQASVPSATTSTPADPRPLLCALRTDADGGLVLRCRHVVAEARYLPREWVAAGERRAGCALPGRRLVVALCLARTRLALDGLGAAPARREGGEEEENDAGRTGGWGAADATTSTASAGTAPPPELVHIVVPPHTAPTSFRRALYVVQQGTSTNACPAGLHIVHVLAHTAGSAEADVEEAVAAVERTVRHLFGGAEETRRTEGVGGEGGGGGGEGRSPRPRRPLPGAASTAFPRRRAPRRDLPCPRWCRVPPT
jgi:RAB protein geranylgeranyltransferase component A